MEQLIKQVNELVAAELSRATTIHGAHHHSSHEAYAVILEERDDGIKEVAELDKSLDEYWMAITINDKEQQDAALSRIEESAILTACEYIQVAAMARKALNGYEKGV